MRASEDENPLDNPVWHALGGALSRFAVSPPAAFLRRFDSEVSPFSAVRDVDASTWDQIAAEIGPEGFCESRAVEKRESGVWLRSGNWLRRGHGGHAGARARR